MSVYVLCFQEGMRQHFDLGHFLRNRYKGFLSESYDRHEVGALASSAFRSHVAGADRQSFILKFR